jgi:hypothetical protein
VPTLRGRDHALIPAPGHHRFRRGWRPFRISFYRSGESRGYSQRRMESFRLATFGRAQSVLRELVEEITAAHRRRVACTSRLYIFDDGCWDEVYGYTPRCLEAVVLPEGEKERLVADLEHFLLAGTEYRRLGVPGPRRGVDRQQA